MHLPYPSARSAPGRAPAPQLKARFGAPPRQHIAARVHPRRGLGVPDPCWHLLPGPRPRGEPFHPHPFPRNPLPRGTSAECWKVLPRTMATSSPALSAVSPAFTLGAHQSATLFLLQQQPRWHPRTATVLPCLSLSPGYGRYGKTPRS